MAKRGRRPVLTAEKKHAILAILGVGCSQRVAARFVGCAPATIMNAAARDREFAAQLGKVMSNAEVTLLRRIREAAKKDQYWRAAAWALERVYPHRYARRGPDVITLEQITNLLAQFAQIVVEEVPIARHRKGILRRLAQLGQSLTGKMPAWDGAESVSAAKRKLTNEPGGFTAISPGSRSAPGFPSASQNSRPRRGRSENL